MKVETKRTLLFVTTILSVLILFLSYYEVFRYVSMYFYNPSYYLNKYSDLEMVNNSVITINSKESNIDKLEMTLKSILDQTLKTSEVVIYAEEGSHSDKLKQYEDYNIIVKEKPKSLYNDNVDVYDSVKKYESTNYIIRLRDDVVYGKDYIGIMLENAWKNPSTLIKQKQGIVYKPDYFSTNIEDAEENDNPFKYLTVKEKNVSYNLNYYTI